MRQRWLWPLALAIVALMGTVPSAQATPTITLSDFSETPVGGGIYDWSVDWTLSGFLSSAMVTVTANGIGLCSPLIGSAGDCSGISSSSAVSGTVYATNVIQSASAHFSSSSTTSMPEPGFAFYLTLGVGLLGIAVIRNCFAKGSHSALPPT
jgi:hypothetical protein